MNNSKKNNNYIYLKNIINKMSQGAKVRKDKNGQIITKGNCKNYHINFSNTIDIINVKSYKLFNKIRDGEYYDEDDFFDDDEEEEKNTEEKDDNNNNNLDLKDDYYDCSSKDSMAFSRPGCLVF